VIGGQSLCLFLTLLLTPVAYEQFDAFEQAIVGSKGKAWLRRAKAAVFVWKRPADMANG